MKFEKKLIFFELRRHYILGVINLITGLGLLNFFQYFIFQNINISLRTDLSITMSYIVGVTISYFGRNFFYVYKIYD